MIIQNFYFLLLCGTVSNLWCLLQSGTLAASLCQVAAGNTQITYTLMTNDTSKIEWSWANGMNHSAGVKFVIHDDDSCSAPRVTIGIISCGNTTSITSVVENPTCTYNLFITSPMLCVNGETVSTLQGEAEEKGEKEEEEEVRVDVKGVEALTKLLSIGRRKKFPK